MNKSEIKADIISSIGSLLSKVQDGKITKSADFGTFVCSIENYDHFSIVRRDFETSGDAMSIPFSCNEATIQMIFSLNGYSAFNDRFDPFLLSPVSHCINFFKHYECRNLLDEHARQNDITFRLKKSFYTDLLTNHLSVSEDRMPEMILHQTEFNTINEHIPADAGILGILKNIMDCPYKGDMKAAFIREHIRALLTLQLFHFNPIISGKKIRQDGRINRRDADILHEVKKYIDQHFLDPTSLEMLSRHFGINDFKLKHGFKMLFDTSPIRYLQYKRLEYSRFLLRDTDKTIKKIADEIGYTHAANFTAAFTKTFGKSPLYYRSGSQERYELIANEMAAS
ncbi:AraC family transcriptional regulator [Chryseolinea sp. H1M3-3]|uniref:helix-turn-helix transcriptional regulator n=1 Tax=Chryseolinea sp. H1M3-3 TaxID=3034144 RepID=UPI0023EDC623|nr:AraC family transcriptional regulator [Chryseolinea sp. H1M3-3]